MTFQKQFGIFVGVGIVATLTHYAVLISLVKGLALEPTLASTAGYGLGAVVNYCLNRNITFQSRRSHLSSIPRFVATASSGLVINAALVASLVHGLAVFYLIAQVISTSIVLFWNFTLNKCWTFSPQPTTVSEK